MIIRVWIKTSFKNRETGFQILIILVPILIINGQVPAVLSASAEYVIFIFLLLLFFFLSLSCWETARLVSNSRLTQNNQAANQPAVHLDS